MRRRRRHSPLVIPPRKHQFAAFHGDCIKCEKRIGGNGGMQLRAEDFAAVVGAFERFDDVARNFLAGIVETETGLHGIDRKSTRLNSSPQIISYALFSFKKKKRI